MREKHPIDQRFKVLYDSEVDPPRSIRTHLADRMGWDKEPSASGPWRSWLLIMAGAAMAVLSLFQRHTPTSTSSSNAQAELQPSPEGPPTHAPVPQGAPAAIPGHGTHPPRSAAATNMNRTLPGQESRPIGGVRATPVPELTRTPGSIQPQPGDPPLDPDRITALPTNNDPTPNVGSQRYSERILAEYEDHGIDQYAPALDATRISPLIPKIGTAWVGSPRQAPRQLPYVLPAGHWWWGAYAGTGRQTGVWEGVDQQALNAAERWRGATQWGILVGRQWRSGWSLSLGAGLGLSRSTLAYDEQQFDRSLSVDTTWTQTLYNNVDVVYTWNIDTVITERPGTMLHTHARNRYGALQIPLNLAWHGQVKRWHYGGLCGVAIHLPTQREGSTLQRLPSDAAVSVVSLRHPSIDTRFGLRANAHLGLSLGYALNEHIGIYAEPLLTTPLGFFGRTNGLSMQGHFIQFRIQHDLGAR